MTEFYTYITKENDRWDLISYKFYNSATLYEEIIKANPDAPKEAILPTGLKLKIPVLKTDNQIKFDLPPWRA